METQVTTLKFRLRDKHAAELNRQARACTFVWNYCNETQRYALRWNKRWPSAFDLQKLTAGTSKDLGLHAHTIQRVCARYAISRQQCRRPYLRWRGKKSLGWVPFNTGHVRFDRDSFVFNGARFQTMHMREIPEGSVIHAGSFNQDSRGRWYINVPIEMPLGDKAPNSVVGVDLGLKDLATMSNGQKVDNPRYYRSLQANLGIAQRARKQRRVKAISARIVNLRSDHLHKASAAIAKANDMIFVGNVSSRKLSRTSMGKSVQDAGWSTFKRMLSYKAIRHGGRMLEVNEAMSTQVCSCCGVKSASSPKGRAGLGIRQWTCSDCGAEHDRDVNAARNIVRMGLHTLAGGTHVN